MEGRKLPESSRFELPSTRLRAVAGSQDWLASSGFSLPTLPALPPLLPLPLPLLLFLAPVLATGILLLDADGFDWKTASDSPSELGPGADPDADLGPDPGPVEDGPDGDVAVGPVERTGEAEANHSCRWASSGVIRLLGSHLKSLKLIDFILKFHYFITFFF